MAWAPSRPLGVRSLGVHVERQINGKWTPIGSNEQIAPQETVRLVADGIGSSFGDPAQFVISGPSNDTLRAQGNLAGPEFVTWSAQAEGTYTIDCNAESVWNFGHRDHASTTVVVSQAAPKPPGGPSSMGLILGIGALVAAGAVVFFVLKKK